jgi:hypothetical protein
MPPRGNGGHGHVCSAEAMGTSRRQRALIPNLQLQPPRRTSLMGIRQRYPLLREPQLRSAAISAYVITQERLAVDDFDAREVADVDVILVDEAHNFRNKRAKRYLQLENILAANGRRGRDGGRKKLILLTATPINNNIFDLYDQINLFTGNDRTSFASAGIGDLYTYFLAARRESIEEGSIRIFNLLEEVVIRRTRQFIPRAYPEATIRGKKITWSSRQLHTIAYDLEATYEGFYKHIVRKIESLNLAHYSMESYKRSRQEQVRAWTAGRAGWHLRKSLPEAVGIQHRRVPYLHPPRLGIRQNLC